MPELRIEYLAIGALVPRASNPRTHSAAQLKQIERSIERFGFTNPVLIDEAGGIIAGHGRVAAARQLGIENLPCVRLANMGEAEIRAYVIADNKLAENAGWDRELLAIEFAWLDELDLDFDLSITGFELPEIDILLDEHAKAKARDAEVQDDIVPEVGDGPAVTRAGDVWQIGEHRLICGDALAAETYAALMGEARAQMVFTDPPYNVPIAGHVSGLGKVQHREFAQATGEMSRNEFARFLSTACGMMASHTVDGALHYVCMDWRHMSELLEAGEAAYSELKNLVVWAKTNGGMGSLYRSQHELVFVFKAGEAPHINNVELGRHGRYRTNVWTYAGVNSFGEERGNLELHPTVKPVAMVADAIRDASHRGGIVLDVFAGSGTTILAAQKTGRNARAIELDPLYCDVIIRRMAETCRLEAKLEATGESFAEVAARRAGEVAENNDATIAAWPTGERA
ncbi:DNA methyltransferase [Novosphingobium sp. PY1]|uniref:site-specific DNA-methyltransferase n=1 Tax=Novosphingobium sp. PY1 TaxID=1882221 RepID=UPI001A8E0E49|nr:DNA methyltransferase [Novosphingobium sp. PY1]